MLLVRSTDDLDSTFHFIHYLEFSIYKVGNWRFGTVRICVNDRQSLKSENALWLSQTAIPWCMKKQAVLCLSYGMFFASVQLVSLRMSYRNSTVLTVVVFKNLDGICGFDFMIPDGSDKEFTPRRLQESNESTNEWNVPRIFNVFKIRCL